MLTTTDEDQDQGGGKKEAKSNDDYPREWTIATFASLDRVCVVQLLLSVLALRRFRAADPAAS